MASKLPRFADEPGPGQTETHSIRSSTWIRVWLACVASYYPVYWLSRFLLDALVALIRVALFGHELTYFQVSFFDAMAASAAPSVGQGPRPANAWAGYHVSADHILLVVLVVSLLTILGRRHPLSRGFGIAIFSNAVLMWPFWRLVVYRRLSAATILDCVLLFGVLSYGLRSMLAGGIARRYSSRVGFLISAVVLPPAAIVGALDLVLNLGLSRSLYLHLGPAAIASFLVSLWPPPSGLSELLPVEWKSVVLAFAASLLLAVAISEGGPALNRAVERARLASNQAAMASIPKIPPGLPYRRVFFQKGVNFTAEFPVVYASGGARRMLQMLPQYGVNAVALVPYGFVSSNRPLVHLNAGINSWESDEGLEELSRVAHARNIKVFLRPALWGARDLKFSSPEDRAKWFGQYGLFLEHYAGLAKRIHADLFSMGGEFSSLWRYDAEWRKLIARVRQFYPGPLVYAANFGEEFERVTFWDDLDYIGLQEYYPLPDDLSTDSIVQHVEAVQRKFSRPVIFTEAGFPNLEAANRQPWDDIGRQISPEQQALCYEALFRAFYRKPWFQGMYWWKVGTNGFGGREDRSHTPWGKPAMDVIKHWYVGVER